MEFTKILRFAGGAAQFKRAAKSGNAMFLAAFGKIFFDVATIDQNIFTITIALLKFRLCKRAFDGARHNRFQLIHAAQNHCGFVT